MVRRDDRLPEVVIRKRTSLTSSEPSPWVRQPTRHLPLFLLLFFASCVTIAIDLRMGFSWLAEISGSISSPIIRSVDLVLSPLSRSASLVGSTLAARRENIELRERLAVLESKLNHHDTVLLENERLRDLLDLKAEKAPLAVAAEVLRYKNDPTARLLTLRGGSNAGFMPNQPAISEAGQLLGRIVQVSSSFSTVRLITDPSCYIGVTLEKTQSQGVLYSRNGVLYVRLDRIEEIPADERVVTSHVSDLYPKGLLIGNTGELTEKPEAKDPMVAAELGLHRVYRVNPALPAEDWGKIREVLCLPVWPPSPIEPTETPTS